MTTGNGTPLINGGINSREGSKEEGAKKKPWLVHCCNTTDPFPAPQPATSRASLLRVDNVERPTFNEPPQSRVHDLSAFTLSLTTLTSVKPKTFVKNVGFF